MTYNIKFDFDPVATLHDLEKKYGPINDKTVDAYLEKYQNILYENILSIKLQLLRSSNLDFTNDSIYSHLPILEIVSDKIINNSNQLDRKYKDLANHNLVDSLVISPLFSKPPIQKEDPGGGGIPSNPYDMYYVKQTVNDTMLYTGNGVKVGILEPFWGTDYAMVDPSIQNFKSGHVIHDPNISYSDYSTHATTVAAISSGHYGIAKNSLIYSTSFKESGSCSDTSDTLERALLWLDQKSNISLENINVDVVNMSFSRPCEIDIIRRYSYQHRKIMITGSGNKHLNPIGYPAAYANVFTVGATNASGTDLWRNPNDSSKGSAYINNINGINKPNIVAPGMISLMNFPDNISFIQGTSYSAPLVTGAVAKLIESRPYLKSYPEVVYALLTATSNPEKVSNIDQQYTLNIGYKTGSGMLDISKLVNNKSNTKVVYSTDFVNDKYTFNLILDNPTYKTRKLNIAAFWLEKYENESYKLSNYDLSVNINGNITTSNSTTNNYELIRLTTNHHGNIVVTIDMSRFSGNNMDLIGVAWTFY